MQDESHAHRVASRIDARIDDYLKDLFRGESRLRVRIAMRRPMAERRRAETMADICVSFERAANFTVLELKNFNDEINSFFMDSYCSKIWNYVKLIRKVLVKWKS